MLADTAQQAVRRVLAVATVQWVDTPQWPISLVLEHRIVLLAVLADMVREEVHRVLAAGTARRAGTL